jgi:hypothetical protein
MFDLLNVKYVLVNNNAYSKLPYECPISNGEKDLDSQPNFGENTLDGQIVTQNSNNSILYQERLNINGSTKPAIYASAPNTFTMALSVPPEPTKLSFSIGLRPDTFRSDRGDGVNFKIDVFENKNETNIFSKYIDPKNSPCDRQWFDDTVDLEKWAGKNVVLSFSTGVGPSGSNYWDVAFWGNIQLVRTSSNSGAVSNGTKDQHYSPIYEDKNVLIYQNNNVLPRSFIVYRAVNVSSFSESIKVISNPAFDLKNTAAVEDLPGAIINAIDNNSGIW